MNSADLISIVQKSRDIDPTLADVLIGMLREQGRIAKIIDPAPIVESKVAKVKIAPAPNVQVFSSSFTDTNVILTWEAPSTVVLFYEIRVGTTWDTAERILTTATLQAVLDPIAIGTTTYLIKAITDQGGYSVDALSVLAVVPDLGTFIITPSVINNFLSLSWTEPVSTFRVDHYILTKDGSTIADAIKGDFTTRQEAAAGRYTYGLTAVDIFGNESSEITTTLDVGAPTDFEVQDSRTSGFTGTIVNGKVFQSKLYVCVDTSITYQSHFTSNGWATPAAQVAAGYPLWITPALTTASYEEIFDFGAIFTNVIVNLSWLFETLVGSFTFGLSTKVSNDGITYGTANTASSFFVTSARYVKVKFTFTGNDDKALLAFSNFICTLAVKREVDGGDVNVFAADAAGTVISFNKTYLFVESITVTPLDTNIRTWVYDFAGGVSPTSFKVKLWNAAGARVDGHVSWKARGVL
jgi:hypothetical protein